MSKISEFLKKQQLLAQLQQELEQLESDPELQAEREFKGSLESLMDQYGKSAEDILEVLKSLDPSIDASSSKAGGKGKRAMIVYKNPHTGEVVRTRGGNHKTLKAWRDEYGAEAVRSWRE